MVLLTFNIINIEAEAKKGSQINDEDRLKITEDNTKAVLRILDVHDIKASFFVEVSLTGKLQNLIKEFHPKGMKLLFIIKIQILLKLKMRRRTFRNF